MKEQVQTKSVTVSQKAVDSVVCWKRWSWEKDLQRVLVVVNQRATGSLLVDSPTDCLIRHEMASRGMTGEVAVAYLTEYKDELSELLALTRRADFVVLAVGTKISSALDQRLKFYIQQCQGNGQSRKLYWLMNSGGKHVHPGELGGLPWQFGPVG
ncbi:hypothetical protein [Levilactobacillus brevis]|uniref:hypothetical protein n=1 Tax=Levilactobacillus brevis TaxID=1580 RepID=UPI001117B658|nr:hypothetical protein [Levilactobacillus brevis]QCZ42421.1 hypothetical protein UCCLBBS124_0061 [Levilactobacillus brevis]